MELDLKNKTAIVCGGTQGIGLGIAKEFSNQGIKLIIIARNKKKIESCVKSFKNPSKHSYICVDFSNILNFENKLTEYFKKHKPQVDILINNTGGPKGGLIQDAKKEEFSVAFNMHVICNQILTSHVLPNMKKSKFGRIINIISTSVKIPINGLGVSNTIRGAVANWSKTLANEVGEFNITVNNILPGFTDTPRLSHLMESLSKKQKKPIADIKKNIISSVPLQRLGTVEDVAHIASFLASSKASYISGTNIPIDGGRTGSL
tara:strand:- start:1265 stop:2050 length:786 start_codon:yes stop_codon:yes gene_type:complete